MTQPAHIPGDRGAAAVSTLESAPARLHKRLALALVAAVGTAVLTWYYHHLVTAAPVGSREPGVGARTAAASEMRLPPLRWSSATPAAPTAAQSASQTGAVMPSPPSAGEGAAVPQATMIGVPPAGAPPLANAALERLSSPVLVRGSTQAATTEPSATPAEGPPDGLVAPPVPEARPGTHGAHTGTLAEMLVPTSTPAVIATIVPTQRWLLPKGAFLDCTLETAIDSTLPGMATCVLAADVFGADGRVVLLERGTRLIGETQSEVRSGQSRVAVLWSDVRTPTGVSVRLASPGTDALGRAGVPGGVDTHFGARFGAAVLLSLIDGGISAAVAHQQGSSGVIYNVQGPQEVGTEVLRNTIGVPPTVHVAPGARVQVLVARDVDFRTVYRLAGHEGG